MFAKAQNIPIVDQYVRVPMDQKPKHRPALLSENLYQWRLLFYMTHITDFELNEPINMKNVCLQYNFLQNKTIFQIQSPNDDKHMTAESSLASENRSPGQSYYEFKFQKKKIPANTGSFAVNAIRVHYFFSETTDVSSFLEKTNVRIAKFIINFLNR